VTSSAAPGKPVEPGPQPGEVDLVLNFSLLLRWLERLLRALMRMLLAISAPAQNA